LIATPLIGRTRNRSSEAESGEANNDNQEIAVHERGLLSNASSLWLAIFIALLSLDPRRRTNIAADRAAPDKT